MQTTVFVFLVCITLTLGQTFNPVPFTLPSPPALSGALSQNYALYNAEKLHFNRVYGPKSFAFLNGNVYTITADRRIVNVAPCNPQTIAVLSARGCSAVEQLYSSTTPVGGRVPQYLNGMVQAQDGTILMSDSGDNFDAVNDIYIIMEGRGSGRILALNPTTKTVSELLNTGLVYPNGLELTPDGRTLLVAESGRARIVSVSLAPESFRQVGVFAQNLPGVPGNIRRSARGTYWVGLSMVRRSGIRNSMDTFSNNVAVRQRTVQTQNQNTIRSYYPRYGMVVELDQTGRIVGSLHDPTGQVYPDVSEAMENEGLLYIGSPSARYVGRIVLPQGDGRIVTVDSVVQVLRSRCQIPENKLALAKSVLTEYINRQNGNTGGGTSGGSNPVTASPTTAAPANNPTTAAPANNPTTAAPANNPTTAAPANNPTTGALTTAPPASSPTTTAASGGA